MDCVYRGGRAKGKWDGKWGAKCGLKHPNSRAVASVGAVTFKSNILLITRYFNFYVIYVLQLHIAHFLK